MYQNIDDEETDDAPDVERISLLDSLDREWLRLPLAIMQDVGPAAQTLGGLLKVTNRETFVKAEKIARRACLPVSTVRKHLAILNEGCWINNVGRQLTRSGRPRRTATIQVTQKARDCLEPYGVLPWWAYRQFPWSAKAVLSIVMARLMSLRKGVEDQDGHGVDASDVAGSIDSHMGGDDRFKFDLDFLERNTGLSRHSVIKAKRALGQAGIVELIGAESKAGITTETNLLVPNWEFRVEVTPTESGYCKLDFDPGCKSGQ